MQVVVRALMAWICGSVLCGGAAAQGLDLRALSSSGNGRPGPSWGVAMQHQPKPALGAVQASDTRPWHVHDALVQQSLDDTRVVIEFRPRSASAEWREWGALRMQFSGQGTLSLKPRRGGMHLAWRAAF